MFLPNFSLYSQYAVDERIEKHFTDEQKKKFYTELGHFQQLVKNRPSDVNTFNYYLALIMDQTEENPLLHLVCVEVYSHMSSLSPDDPTLYNNWAVTLWRLSKHIGDFELYGEEVESLLLKAESMSDQFGAYNLACYYSVTKNKNKAFEWLDRIFTNEYKIKSKRERVKAKLESDSDFDNIRNDRRFKKILNKYFE